MIRRYLKKSKEIIKNEGFGKFLSKAYHFIFTPFRERFDQFITKLFSSFSIKGFHKLFYYTFFTEMAGRNKDIFWFGIPVSKCPLDLWIYQEIIYKLKPDFIIETGTDRGGSALFFASILDLLGKGKVITIDINNFSREVSHPRIKKIINSSIFPETINEVRKVVGNKTAMVVLDSDHQKEHVLKEMELYSQFVSVGSYLVVEDTNINGHPVMPGWGPGPMEAVKEFLKKRSDFMIDKSREKFMVTFCPNGFLKKLGDLSVPVAVSQKSG